MQLQEVFDVRRSQALILLQLKFYLHEVIIIDCNIEAEKMIASA